MSEDKHAQEIAMLRETYERELNRIRAIAMFILKPEKRAGLIRVFNECWDRYNKAGSKKAEPIICNVVLMHAGGCSRQGLRLPGVWYLAAIETPEMAAIGATMPGLPGIVIGRNRDLAWGFTNTGSDTQDLFVERIEPGRPDRYLTPDGAAAFVTRQEVISVKGAPDKAALIIRA